MTPSLGFKTNGPAQKTILTGTRALFLRRQYYANISILIDFKKGDEPGAMCLRGIPLNS